MEEILAFSDDEFLEFSASFCGDAILDEIDFDDIYDPSVNNYQILDDFTNTRVQDNCVPLRNGDGSLVAKENPSETAESKLLKIRRILDSNIPQNVTVVNKDLVSSHAVPNNSPKANLSTDVLIGTQSKQKPIVPKQAVILPAAAPSNIMRTPTLAATLIGMPSSMKIETFDSDDTKFPKHGKIRRNSHNAIEKRYRLSINDKIDELRAMLYLDDDGKMNKSAVLKKAIDRIRLLEEENNSLRCENNTLRVSLNERNSTDSLHQTDSSLSSNNSETSHSLGNSPTSSTMHGSNIPSSYMYPQVNLNSYKGLKRPLICDSNDTSGYSKSKKDKLVRLLETPDENQKPKLNQIQLSFKNDAKFHNSTVPNFLLCTLALLMVSFEPIKVILSNYKMKSNSFTTGRQIFSKTSQDVADSDVLFTVLLTLLHWIFAFILIWNADGNFKIWKIINILLSGIFQCFTPINYSCNSQNSVDIKKLQTQIEVWKKNPTHYKSAIVENLKFYGCNCPTNAVSIFCQTICIGIRILFDFIFRKRKCETIISGSDNARILLLTVTVEISLLNYSVFSRLERLWYKAIILLHILQFKQNPILCYSRLLLTQSLRLEFLRKYLIDRQFRTLCNQNNMDFFDCGCHWLVENSKAQKIFSKVKPSNIRERLSEHDLIMGDYAEFSLLQCYFLHYIHDVMSSATRIIESNELNEAVNCELRNIINTSTVVLPYPLSESISYSSHMMLAFLTKKDDCLLEKTARRLLQCFKKTVNSSDDVVFVNTMNLFILTLTQNSVDNHTSALQLLKTLINCRNMNYFTELIINKSLEKLCQSLSINTSLSSESQISYIIEYIKILKLSKNSGIVFRKMTSEFEILLEELCHINPQKREYIQVEIKLIGNGDGDNKTCSKKNIVYKSQPSKTLLTFDDIESIVDKQFKMRTH